MLQFSVSAAGTPSFHAAGQVGSIRFFQVPDLGLDRVMSYTLDGNKLYLGPENSLVICTVSGKHGKSSNQMNWTRNQSIRTRRGVVFGAFCWGQGGDLVP